MSLQRTCFFQLSRVLIDSDTQPRGVPINHRCARQSHDSHAMLDVADPPEVIHPAPPKSPVLGNKLVHHASVTGAPEFVARVEAWSHNRRLPSSPGQAHEFQYLPVEGLDVSTHFDRDGPSSKLLFAS